MSNIDKITANEQLFTELPPEEGAAINGGGWLGDAVDWVADKATDGASVVGGVVGGVFGGAGGAVVGAIGGAFGADTNIIDATIVGAKGGYDVGTTIV